MPSRPDRTCPRHGRYRPDPRGCPTCRTERQVRIDRQRGTAAARGYGVEWAALSIAYRRLHPVCERSGCLRASEHVDHLDGLGPNGPHGRDASNLEALCAHHHGQRTQRDQGGGWAARGADGGRA